MVVRLSHDEHVTGSSIRSPCNVGIMILPLLGLDEAKVMRASQVWSGMVRHGWGRVRSSMRACGSGSNHMRAKMSGIDLALEQIVTLIPYIRLPLMHVFNM